MQIPELGPAALTLIASLVVAVVLLALRVVVLQRAHGRRHREVRQESSERLRSLVAAYRSLAGSFAPATEADRPQLEEALSDIVLFGSLAQVEMAAACARALLRGEPVATQALAEELRAALREQLGLEPIPSHVRLPPSGPGRGARGPEGQRGSGGRGSGSGGGIGGGIGGGGPAAGLGGLGLGLGLGRGGPPASA